MKQGKDLCRGVTATGMRQHSGADCGKERERRAVLLRPQYFKTKQRRCPCSQKKKLRRIMYTHLSDGLFQAADVQRGFWVGAFAAFCDGGGLHAAGCLQRLSTRALHGAAGRQGVGALLGQAQFDGSGASVRRCFGDRPQATV